MGNDGVVDRKPPCIVSPSIPVYGGHSLGEWSIVMYDIWLIN